jgi:hypothetical protein
VDDLAGTLQQFRCKPMSQRCSSCYSIRQANQFDLEWMALKAIDAYGGAPASLAKALQDPVEILKDSLLATPYLIGQYEVKSVLGLPNTNFREGKLTFATQAISGYSIYQPVFSWIIITMKVKCFYFDFMPAVNSSLQYAKPFTLSYMKKLRVT